MRIEAWHWVVLGTVLAVAEIFAPATVLLWSGGAAIVLGLALWALPPVDWQWQIVGFITLAVAAVTLGLKLRRPPADTAPPHDVNLGSARLVGQRATLETAIVNGHGTIRLGDAVWQVSGPDLPAGTTVTISGSDGITLVVTT
ncbi:MAG: NfeD family protein [Alphaproteobacteria bacterium]|nr:NfeD family protein [Alphaproteobacteria bacterium]